MAFASPSGSAVDPGREHYFPPVRVLVGDAAVGLPVIDLGDGVDADGGQPCRDALLRGVIGQVEYELITSLRWIGRRAPQPDDLQVYRAAGQAEDRPVQAVAVVERFQHRQADDVPVEDDRLVVPRTPPHHPQRTHRKMRWPARALRLW